MQVYNSVIFSFIAKVTCFAKEILVKEAKVDVKRNRFQIANHLYPLKIVVFTGKSKIGYFEQSTYQIGLNENLIHETRDHIIKDILRHELAHYLTFIKYPKSSAHGAEFKEICESNNWNKSISKSTMDIKEYKKDYVANLENERTLSKVKKLLQLASSANENEAQLATIKANQLLLRHNLKESNLNQHEESFYVKRVLYSKKRNSKMSAIYDILTTFYVNPVLRYAVDGVYLEVCATKLNIELSDYVVAFLDSTLDNLWEQSKTQKSLKGLKAKNSFFHGLAKGYESKINSVHSNLDPSQKMALTLFRANSSNKIKQIYKSLSSTSSNSSIDQNAYISGKKAGISLTINKGIKSNSNKLLGLFK